MRALAIAALLLPLLAGAPARAVIIAGPDGTINTTPPEPPYDDPGFDNVGEVNFKTGVYLGNGWVLTANHVGAHTITLGGVSYDPVPGVQVRLENGFQDPADLLLFGIDPAPPLPSIAIRSAPLGLGTPVIMIGRGRNRGDPTDSSQPGVWSPPPPPPNPPAEGWFWGGGTNTIRWGTNQVDDLPAFRVSNTVVFEAAFDDGQPDYEAMGSTGDSGGAVFAYDGSAWELAGIMLEIRLLDGQNLGTSLYGDGTWAGDLTVYRDQIEDVIAVPEPGEALGLASGIAFLALLGRRRLFA